MIVHTLLTRPGWVAPA